MLGIMSTIYRAPEPPRGGSSLWRPAASEPEVAEAAAAEPAADIPKVSTEQMLAEQPLPDEPAPRALWERVPTPLFITVYGALIIAGVVLAVMLVNQTSDVAAKSIEMAQPSRPFNKAPIDEANVAASVRPYLIENAEVAETETGVTLRGDIAENAVLMPSELSGHVSRLLEQNCLNSATLEDPEGMRLNFWGFCFSTIPPATIEELVSFAKKSDADSVDFYNYPQRSNRHEVSVNWMDAGSSEDLDQMARDRRKAAVPDEVDRIIFNAYGDDEMIQIAKDRSTGITAFRGPTGEAFREEWGLK